MTMPLIFAFPAMMFFATLTVMGQAAIQLVPVTPSADPAKARRRAFKVIKGGQDVVLIGAERACYRHRQEP
jgi:hypothetical protein